jgi:hypothetical protein
LLFKKVLGKFCENKDFGNISLPFTVLSGDREHHENKNKKNYWLIRYGLTALKW